MNGRPGILWVIGGIVALIILTHLGSKPSESPGGPAAASVATPRPKPTLSASTFCRRWGALLPAGASAIVTSYRCRAGLTYSVTATISDQAWESFDYDQRLRLAKAFWSGCLRASRVDDGDACYIHLVGEAGERLGGSGWAGSLIDVKSN